MQSCSCTAMLFSSDCFWRFNSASGKQQQYWHDSRMQFPTLWEGLCREKAYGRFSNGNVPSDLIGGSGYDPLTPKIVSVLSLSDQLELFKKYISKINAAVGKERTATIVSKSIYIVCTGSDDIANTYLSTPLRRPHYDIPAYTDHMVKSASSFFQELYGLGARKIGVASLPAIGCVPSQRTLSGGIDKGCSETANQAASLFNSKLSAQIDAFIKRPPEARLVYLDIYNTLLSLIQNPTQYGFEVINRGCCGTGNFKVCILCTRYSPGTCNDSSKYIFWDSYHPSEKGYEVITPLVFDSQVHKFF